MITSKSSRIHTVVATLLGSLCILAGVIVIAGWYLHNEGMLAPSRAFPPMQFNAALCLLLSGGALVAAAIGKRRFALVATVACLLGVLTQAQYLLEIDFGIDRLFVEPFTTAYTSHPGRMGPVAAICFATIGSAISLSVRIASSKVRVAIGALAAFTLGLGSASVVGYLTGIQMVEGWSKALQIAVPAAMGFVSLGLGTTLLLLDPMTEHRKPSDPHWMPIAATTGITAFFLWLSLAVAGQRQTQGVREIDAHAAAIRYRIDDALKSRLDALHNMGVRWTNSPSPSETLWKADAAQALRDQPGLITIAWIDPSGGIRFRVDRASAPFDNLLDDQTKAAMRRVLQEGGQSSFLPLYDEGSERRTRLLVPLGRSGNPDGFLVAVQQTAPLVDAVIDDTSKRHFEVSLRNTPKVAERTKPLTFATVAHINGRRLFDLSLPGVRWQLVVSAHSSFLDQLESPFARLVFFGGLGLAALVGLAIYLAQLASVRALEAAQVSLAKGQFLANMSHEIHVPLSSVMRMADLLASTGLTPDQREYVDQVRRSGQVLLSLISDVLDFSKVESGNLSLEAYGFNLLTSIEDVARQLGHQALERRTEIVIDYPQAIPTRFIGDAGRMRQLLTNLIGNATKFTEKGTILITVSLLEQIGNSAQLRVAVKDTGVGLTPAQMDRLFQPFVHTDSASPQAQRGTGLGLAISKHLVGLMGGEMGAESNAGRGSLFWFTLTLPIDPARVVELGPPGSLAGVRVLIVDDNVSSRAMLQQQTTAWGMRATGCASGESALTALRAAAKQRDPYGIAIVDHHVPKMDGHSLAALVKEDESIRDTALVMLTALSKRGDGAVVREAGFSGYLVKPVEQHRLLNVLSTLCNARAHGIDPGLVTRHTVAESIRPPSLSGGDAFIGQGKRALVVEDNLISQTVARRILEQLGFEVEVANNGLEAIELAGSRVYDVILMDCQMPVLDGYQAAIRIRRDMITSVPIIAVTAHTLPDDRERCLAAEMDDCIEKPITLAAVASALRPWFVATDQN